MKGVITISIKRLIRKINIEAADNINEEDEDDPKPFLIESQMNMLVI